MKWLRRLFAGLVLWRLFANPPNKIFAPPQEHPWRTPGTSVFVGDDEFLVRRSGPQGRRPILLIHGLAGSSLGEWYQIGQKLATGREVIMVDHRNHGVSPQGTGRYEIEDAADDYAGVLDALGVGLIDVVGYSMGGAIAQSLANRYPGRVGRLVLIATFATHAPLDRWLRRVGAVVSRAWERLTGLGTPEVRFEYLVATGSVERKHARWLWNETHRRTPDGGAQASFALLRFDSTGWVDKLEVPAMVVIPGNDLLVPPAWQYHLASLLPGVRIVEIPDAGHEVVWSHPDRLVDEIDSFLS